MQVMEDGWSTPIFQPDKTKNMGAKFKNLRNVLRQWYAQQCNLAKTIDNNKVMLSFLDTLEEFRDLTLEEWNFRKIIQENLEKLLEQQRIYWKQR
jgi:hypothetical protein